MSPLQAALAAHLPIAPVLLPLAAGIVLLALRRAPLALQRAVSVLALLLLLALDVALWLQVQGGAPVVYALGNWPVPVGIVLVADRLAAWMLLVTALVALGALLHALHGEDAHGPHFHVLFQWQLFGLDGAFLTGDLFNLFVFFEVLLLASYGLLLHGGGRLRTRAGLHYVVLNLLGSTLFLFAVGTLYGVAGTLNMADLAVRLPLLPQADWPLLRSALLVLLVVFALKAALLPLSLWLPAAYGNTGAGVAALLAVMTKVGAYAILRVHIMLLGGSVLAGWVQPWLLALALATVAAGAAGTLAATSLRQQTGHLIVLSMGTLLLGFALDTPQSLAAGLYYLPHSVFVSAALFLLADLLVRTRGAAADGFGPAPAMPQRGLLAALFLVLAVNVAGLPPLSGFVGKFMLLQAALGQPHWIWVWAVVLGGGLATLVALSRSGTSLFMRVLPADAATASALPRSLLPAAGLLAALGVGMALAAGPLSAAATAVAQQIAQPQGYLHAVLGAER
ncbi:monovalent cation/H+ antiporter subunit D [Thiomonas sp.]|uniref:monovalent cation/H+ antiporter subunit D n=1 Tax=Thiomonas sp. TaxID=2047785 RepID=UPI00261E2FA5|nr:monovalent cation/H+ antiporter subunit D [Thiomonas sp.]